MVSWITELLQRPALMGQHAIIAILLFTAMLVTSLAVALAILISLPADYFCERRAQAVPGRARGAFFYASIALRNLIGATLIVLGAILSVPGLPGQGLLTMLAGALLMEFPGKRNCCTRS